eukprot:12425147-Karenia_brevis.AAC.1
MQSAAWIQNPSALAIILGFATLLSGHRPPSAVDWIKLAAYLLATLRPGQGIDDGDNDDDDDDE